MKQFILERLSHSKVVVDDLLCRSSVVVVSVETRGGRSRSTGRRLQLLLLLLLLRPFLLSPRTRSTVCLC